MLIVLRIRGIDNLSNEVKKIFRVLNLNSVNSLSFLKNEEKVLEQIKKVESYLTYGLTDKKTLSELLYKKGFAKIEDNKRIPLTSNAIIE